MLETSLDKLYKLLEVVYEDLDKTKDMISKLQLEARKEALKDVPGLEGIFDGKYLTSDTGEKLEVPANYAAKSRIVYGDRLKAYEDDGKQMFKQLEKVPRLKVSAVISKKEGKFFALTEFGSHEISPIAVEFNHVSVNDKIQVILPETNTKAPYAALDKIIEQKDAPIAQPVPVTKVSAAPIKRDPKPVQKVEQVQDINKEFVMDLAASPVVAVAPVVVTPAPVVQSVASVVSAPVVQPTPVAPAATPRQSNASTPTQPARRSPARRPATSNQRSSGNNSSQGGRSSNPPRYPSRQDNNAPVNNRDSVSDLKPSSPTPPPAPKFILEDDDLR